MLLMVFIGCDSASESVKNDNSQRRNVLVIGVNAAEALFPGKEGDIVGKMVRMNGQLWEVIGVIEKRKNGFFGENEEDRKIFMPLRTSQKVAPQRDSLFHIIKAKPDRIQEALLDAESVLRVRRGVKYGDANNFDIKTDRYPVKPPICNTFSLFLISEKCKI